MESIKYAPVIMSHVPHTRTRSIDIVPIEIKSVYNGTLCSVIPVGLHAMKVITPTSMS